MAGRTRRSPGIGGIGRERASAFLGFGISIVALAGLVLWALDQPAPRFPTSPGSIALLAATLAVIALAIVARGFRWSVILHRAGISVWPVEPYALILVGFMGNTVLPFRGGEALRVVLLKDNSDASWSNAIGSIIPERLLDVMTLILLLALVVVGGVVQIPGGVTPPLVALAALVAGLAAAFVYRRLRARGRLQRFADRIRPIAGASRLLMTPAGPWLALLSVGIWALDGTVFYLVAQSLSLQISPLEAVGLALVAAAFSAIPAGPAFAGTYDVALVFALTAMGVDAGAALSFVLLFRFVAFLPIAVAGLAVLIARYGGLSKLRRRVPEGAIEGAALETGGAHRSASETS